MQALDPIVLMNLQVTGSLVISFLQEPYQCQGVQELGEPCSIMFDPEGCETVF